ncbi:hypothetical protein [Archangium lipolyticum]|uniref:hypothetical protein n=1 Tax=Archangium lipolyticum TaxID=2970465 RepID=UPI00214A5D94|nr:hypothetical protein [Archangium lipolyticum]
MFVKYFGRATVMALVSASLFGCGGSEMGLPDGDAAESGVVTEPTATVMQGLTRGDVDYRAWRWVDVRMPYCGGVNGGPDAICGGTCVRNGDANTAEWNGYRSDCSGLVSWAWGVPGPGWTTGTIYGDTNVTQRVGYWDMQMGDAITTHNASTNKGHTMIFHGWNADGSARIFQELQCGTVAQDVNIPFVKNSDGSLKWTADGRTYWPVRKKVL